MFIEKIKTEGLAHLSYLIGGGGHAAVIDPRRDCTIYIEKARAKGCRISHIFETHRNEDLISGAPGLAELTGAVVHHGPHAAGEVAYAQTVREGVNFHLGSMTLKVFETPGHTDDSLSFAVFDEDFGDRPVGVFTGDALFVGDVGRTDFYPARAEEVAGLLYDSLRKLLALGDEVLIYPAHGAGSVCGSGMADREFSSLGYERRFNPMLGIDDRDAFIARKVNEHHEQPPYFRHMEALNLCGAPGMKDMMIPPALTPGDFESLARSATILDVRAGTAWLGAHLEESLAIPAGMIPAFAGWYLQPDEELLIVAGNEQQAGEAARSLGRIGFDNVCGYLNTGLPAWAASGRSFASLPVVNAEKVAGRVDAARQDWILLDVRDHDELESGVISGATTIYAGHLPQHLDSLDREAEITVMCASGARATIAASILTRAGFKMVDVFLGSMGAWKAGGNPVVEPA